MSYYFIVCNYTLLLLLITLRFSIIYNSFNKFFTTLSFLYISNAIIINFITNSSFFKSTDDDDCAYISLANILPIVCGCWVCTRDIVVYVVDELMFDWEDECRSICDCCDIGCILSFLYTPMIFILFFLIFKILSLFII